MILGFDAPPDPVGVFRCARFTFLWPVPGLVAPVTCRRSGWLWGKRRLWVLENETKWMWKRIFWWIFTQKLGEDGSNFDYIWLVATQRFFLNFHSENWGGWSHFDKDFSMGLVQPPARKRFFAQRLGGLILRNLEDRIFKKVWKEDLSEGITGLR